MFKFDNTFTHREFYYEEHYIRDSYVQKQIEEIDFRKYFKWGMLIDCYDIIIPRTFYSDNIDDWENIHVFTIGKIYLDIGEDYWFVLPMWNNIDKGLEYNDNNPKDESWDCTTRGLNLIDEDQRRLIYFYPQHIIPEMVRYNLPQKNRPDIYEIMKKHGLRYYEDIEMHWAIRYETAPYPINKVKIPQYRKVMENRRKFNFNPLTMTNPIEY